MVVSSLKPARAACSFAAASVGGTALYKGKAFTWNSVPVIPKDPTGLSSTFAGAVAGFLSEHGHLDFRGLKRGLGYASAIAGACAGGIGPKALFSINREEVNQLFTRLRRVNKM